MIKQSLFYKYIAVIITCLSAFVLSSCSDDKNVSADSNIVGDWTGYKVYTNPVSGTVYQQLSIKLTSTGAGNLEYESRGYIAVAVFEFSVKGNIITCKGSWINSDGDKDSSFSMILEIQGDRIVTTDLYQGFILTRDGSVTTDSNGIEIDDYSDLLPGIWVRYDFTKVLLITSVKEFELYYVDPNNHSKYKYKEWGEYHYDFEKRRLILYAYHTSNDSGFKCSVFDIYGMGENTLVLHNQDNLDIETYNRGDSDDIPTTKR